MNDRISAGLLAADVEQGNAQEKFIALASHSTDVNLAGMDFGDDGVTDIAKIVNKFANVTSLDLSKNGITDEGAVSLAVELAIRKPHKIADRILSMFEASFFKIDLRFNKISDWGACELAAAVMKNRNYFFFIDLRSNDVGPMGCRAIAAAFRCSSSSFGLSNNRIGDEGAIYLADTFIPRPRVPEISLVSNGIGPTGCKAVARGLAHNRSVNALNLTDNEVGVEGARAIASHVISTCQLKKLYLGGNNIGPEGAVVLAASFVAAPFVIELDLGGNFIGDKGAKAIAAFLAKPTCKITRLDLRGNEITDEGLQAIVESLEHNHSLATLGLGANKITDVGADDIVTALEEAYANLRSIDLSWNRLSECGITKIQKAKGKAAVDVSFNKAAGEMSPRSPNTLVDTTKPNISQAPLDQFSSGVAGVNIPVPSYASLPSSEL
eukprot:NODE_2345_length_1443_cov_125.187879_g2228_i0.p1 GENE.NODE_2345_length_1443_cov_125.187879_g2228_i0~~NODE_2345_length_1443_cov_125.187879_g2228_i0.p1  ORF type:complete len:438 (+),score=42.03 NODE_2345_length_1443_cov_125.187879_g2228_i0:86-1399(+)